MRSRLVKSSLTFIRSLAGSWLFVVAVSGWASFSSLKQCECGARAFAHLLRAESRERTPSLACASIGSQRTHCATHTIRDCNSDGEVCATGAACASSLRAHLLARSCVSCARCSPRCESTRRRASERASPFFSAAAAVALLLLIDSDALQSESTGTDCESSLGAHCARAAANFRPVASGLSLESSLSRQPSNKAPFCAPLTLFRTGASSQLASSMRCKGDTLAKRQRPRASRSRRSLQSQRRRQRFLTDPQQSSARCPLAELHCISGEQAASVADPTDDCHCDSLAERTGSDLMNSERRSVGKQSAATATRYSALSLSPSLLSFALYACDLPHKARATDSSGLSESLWHR